MASEWRTAAIGGGQKTDITKTKEKERERNGLVKLKTYFLLNSNSVHDEFT